ncbi:UvrD-helicase domain-containing protein [Ilumatobacter sp.]|uniref:UvrD-helicase domain-containing protein n=1 Tax=Ilumatobacter sp. TaxID=1967498 RepID=UPI003B51A2BB
MAEQGSLFDLDDDPGDRRDAGDPGGPHEPDDRHDPGGLRDTDEVPDRGVRRRIADDLATTLFVEAGAGAGKTTALVERVVNLVESGIDITRIAAITFTEKAAAELRGRARTELTELDTPRARRAVDDLDHAPIGTLHAFARRILDDFPIESRLPPGFSVLDELESDLRFDEDWSELLDDLLADPSPGGGITAGGTALVELCEFDGFGLERGLRSVADDFRDNWDLVEDLVDLSDVAALELDCTGVVELARELGDTATPSDDTQGDRVAEIGELGQRLADAELLTARLRLLDHLGRAARRGSTKGAKAKWKRDAGIDALESLRAAEADLADRCEALLEVVRAHRKRVVGAICGRLVLDGVRGRIRAGLLDFHDLLVHARHLLATNPGVRRILHERYPRVLLDEFQDTDPIQLEIAVRLTAAPDDPAQEGEWRELRPIPGRLFIVGDPKQSIYRFRRADISQYLRAADQVGADTGRLTANFRSTRAVIGFTNDVFDRMIVEDPDSQPAFQELVARRDVALLEHGTVSVLGAQLHEDLADGSWQGEHGAADELRRREARDVVGAITAALRDGWPVEDHETGGVRPCRPGDICVLLPARLSLHALEAELRRVELPYRAENAAVVYAAAEVRDLLMALRAADDPTDELATIAALRSPMYGCSDVELWEWKRAGGSWGPWTAPPEGFGGHRVAEAVAHLRSIGERSAGTGVADLMAAVVDERRMFDVALSGPDARDVWRRLRFVIDQARAWADAGGRGLRRYLSWARLQAADGRISDTVLPERDHDAVRLMTVHASKGLEFPITVVSGMTTQPRRRRGTEVVWTPDAWMLSGRGDDGTFADVRPIDELMSDAERRRLLYVACTRAVDHLIVSLHRQTPDAKLAAKGEGTYTSAELLHRCGAAEPSSGAVPLAVEPEVVTPPPGGASLPDLGDVDLWRSELATTFETASRRSAIAATRLADEVRALRERERTDDPGLDKSPVNIDLPPWQRGRYGTAIGRAVHGTLQFCDLATGVDIDDLARSQCAAESILGFDADVAALARSAIRAPIVRAVVDGAEHWRELFIAAPVGERILEGYIDLLVRTPEGLVIVDYKTDRWSGPVQTAERVGRYRTQLAAYGAALASTLDEPVVGGVLVRCVAGSDPEQIDIDGWSDALDDVRRLVGRDAAG